MYLNGLFQEESHIKPYAQIAGKTVLYLLNQKRAGQCTVEIAFQNTANECTSQKMNVLLIYPRYPETFWSFKHVLNFVSKKAAFPPLGLLTVASMLPKDWNKKVVDVNVKGLSEADIEKADMVFLSAMIIQKESSRKIIEGAASAVLNCHSSVIFHVD